MKFTKFFLLVSSVFIILSCGESSGGLFYSLEQESAIENGSLEDDITVKAMVRSNGYYFLAAGSFFYKSCDADTDDPWRTKSPIDSETETYLTKDLFLGYDGVTLFALFIDSDATSSYVYKADTSLVDEDTDIVWEEVTFTNDIDFSGSGIITGFEQAGDYVFVKTSDGYSTYSIYSKDYETFDDNTSFDSIASYAFFGDGVMNADYDGSSTYWIVSGTHVYTTDGTSSGTDVSSDIQDTSEYLFGNGYGGVLCADTHTDSGVEVYVTSEEGLVLRYISGSWEVVETSEEDDDEIMSTPLNRISHIQISNDDEDIDIIVVGSSTGYYEMDAVQSSEDKYFICPEDDETELTESDQYSSISLSEEIVLDFFLDDTADDDRVFTLGYNSGLWKNTLQDGVRFWDEE